jgi:hypothetical protein
MKMLKVLDQGTCKRLESSWNNVPKSGVSIKPKKRKLQNSWRIGLRLGESIWKTKQGGRHHCLTQNKMRARPNETRKPSQQAHLASPSVNPVGIALKRPGLAYTFPRIHSCTTVIESRVTGTVEPLLLRSHSSRVRRNLDSRPRAGPAVQRRPTRPCCANAAASPRIARHGWRAESAEPTHHSAAADYAVSAATQDASGPGSGRTDWPESPIGLRHAPEMPVSPSHRLPSRAAGEPPGASPGAVGAGPNTRACGARLRRLFGPRASK